MSFEQLVCMLAERWAAARAAFLALPPGSPDAKARLNNLAEAEDKLTKAFK